MARGLSIRFINEEGLREKFIAMATEAQGALLTRVVPPAAEITEQKILSMSPVRTGVLRRSLSMKIGEQSAGRIVMNVEIAAKAFYWRFIEFGAKYPRAGKHGAKADGSRPLRIHPKPFIRPAFSRTRSAVRNEMRDRFRDWFMGFAE